jgi:hypothetical protein
MSLWGNKDSKSATGTVSIADTGVVTGSSTLFTTEAKVGNTIRAAGVDYLIVTITSNTVALVRMGRNNGGGLVTTCSGETYTLSEKPAFVALESSDSGIGVSGDSNKVFGVDVDWSMLNQSVGSHPNYTTILGDSSTVGKYWDVKISGLFVDTFHIKEQVLSELYFWYPHVEEGGSSHFTTQIGLKVNMTCMMA